MNTKAITTLSEQEILEVNGGVAPLLGALMTGLGYIGVLQTAADFGAGLGAGFYDFVHKS